MKRLYRLVELLDRENRWGFKGRVADFTIRWYVKRGKDMGDFCG